MIKIHPPKQSYWNRGEDRWKHKWVGQGVLEGK